MFKIFATYHLLIILACGIWTSKSDITFGKIKNKDLICFLVLGFTSYIILFILAGEGELLNSTMRVYIKNFSVNFFISAVISYLIWHFGLWTAGDAKLYITFSFLIPLNFYSSGYLEYFPGLILLINVFLSAFVFVFMVLLANYRAWLYDKEKDHKFYLTLLKNKFIGFYGLIRHPGFKNHISYIVIIFLSSQLMTFIPIQIFQNIFFIFLILLTINYYLKRLDKKWNISYMYGVFGLLSVIGVLIIIKSPIHGIILSIFKTFIFILSFYLIDKAINSYIKVFDTKYISVGDLFPKMILSDESVDMIKQNINNADFFVRAEGVDKDQISIIKNLPSKEHQSVGIYRTMPFAPWIFAGVIITLILKQSVVHYFLSILKDGF